MMLTLALGPVILTGILLLTFYVLAAFRGAAIAQALQNRRYKKLKVQSELEAVMIKIRAHERIAATREAREAQQLRSERKSRELFQWGVAFLSRDTDKHFN